jgi:predicted signal transduction protein with EAL and GGDEF domain
MHQLRAVSSGRYCHVSRQNDRKGRVTHYDAELNSARERKLAIENQIRGGLERDEFEVWYQPIIDARSQKMSSVEALVRWPRRPEGPGPDAFIAIAETSGLIYKLGQFVLQRACQRSAALR